MEYEPRCFDPRSIELVHCVRVATALVLSKCLMYRACQEFAQGFHFVMFSCVLMTVSFINIIQGYFTGTGAILPFPTCLWKEYQWMIHANLLIADIISTACAKHTAEASFTNTLHWRHNEPDDVSNHQPRDCLLNRLFRRRSKKTSNSASLALVWGIHRWPVNSPRKGPVTRKMFPFDDVIMRT